MRYRRAKIAGGYYFFTVVTCNRRPFFKKSANVELLKKALAHVRKGYPFSISAYVIMPDHIHCIWRLPEEDADFSTRWRLIKHFVTVNSHGPVWQKRFWEHAIRDEDDLRLHIDYIHINPVKHGLAKSPGEWPHSSFGYYLNKGWYEPGWGDNLPAFDGEFGE